MPFGVAMYFDAVTESRLRELWVEFARLGTRGMEWGEARPHVSLGICNRIDFSRLRTLVHDTAGDSSTFSITLTSLSFFAGSGVAYLAVKPTPELRAFHAAFFKRFLGIAREVREHYNPQQWVPHCTLAMNLKSEKFDRAHGVCEKFGLPFHGAIHQLGIVEVRPVRQLFNVRLPS